MEAIPQVKPHCPTPNLSSSARPAAGRRKPAEAEVPGACRGESRGWKGKDLQEGGLTCSQPPGDKAHAVPAPSPHPTARRTRSRERTGSRASISAEALLWGQRSQELQHGQFTSIPRAPRTATVTLTHLPACSTWPPQAAQLTPTAQGSPWDRRKRGTGSTHGTPLCRADITQPQPAFPELAASSPVPTLQSQHYLGKCCFLAQGPLLLIL